MAGQIGEHSVGSNSPRCGYSRTGKTGGPGEGSREIGNPLGKGARFFGNLWERKHADHTRRNSGTQREKSVIAPASITRAIIKEANGFDPWRAARFGRGRRQVMPILQSLPKGRCEVSVGWKPVLRRPASGRPGCAEIAHSC